jgi:hypothetical protein
VTRYTEIWQSKEHPMPHTTPLARSKTSALARVLDSVPKGYGYYTAGECPAGKAMVLLKKFHERYGIGCTPAERLTRKSKDLANTLLVMYWPEAEGGGMKVKLHADSPFDVTAARFPVTTKVSWLLLATEGGGPIWGLENLRSVQDKRRLNWLGYELVRHQVNVKTAWTWRRTKEEMENLYRLLGDQLGRRHHSAVAETLERIARQPGFAGVREQSWKLCEFARQRGYTGDLPHLYYVQKVSHGERVLI